jgi:hypothetical protein
MVRPRIVALLAAALLTTGAAAGSLDARSIPIPDDFAPEGVAVGENATFYVGSLWDGDIYRGSLRTGRGRLLVDTDGGMAAGLKVETARNRLWVAGGVTGKGLVYDTRDGDLIASLELTEAGASLINDVFVTRQAAYFTDSMHPNIYVVPLGPGRRIGDPETLPVTGPAGADIGFPGLNGIVATSSGSTLIVGHSLLGGVYTVDPKSGASERISLPAGVIPSGVSDGLLLEGRTLWVVENFNNRVTELRLSRDLSSGFVTNVIDNSDVNGLFRVPTTIARHGENLVLVNGRFDVGLPPPFGQGAPPGTDYDVVVVEDN